MTSGLSNPLPLHPPPATVPCNNRRPPSQPAEVQLSACSVFSEETGLGQCDVLVDASAFPVYGSPAIAASVRLEVRLDGVTTAVSESFPLELRAAPKYPPLEEVGGWLSLHLGLSSRARVNVKALLHMLLTCAQSQFLQNARLEYLVPCQRGHCTQMRSSR